MAIPQRREWRSPGFAFMCQHSQHHHSLETGVQLHVDLTDVAASVAASIAACSSERSSEHVAASLIASVAASVAVILVQSPLPACCSSFVEYQCCCSAVCVHRGSPETPACDGVTVPMWDPPGRLHGLVGNALLTSVEVVYTLTKYRLIA